MFENISYFGEQWIMETIISALIAGATALVGTYLTYRAKIDGNRTSEEKEHIKLGTDHERLETQSKALQTELHEGLRDISSDFKEVHSFIAAENEFRRTASHDKQDALNSIDALRAFVELSDVDARFRLHELELKVNKLTQENAILQNENKVLKMQNFYRTSPDISGQVKRNDSNLNNRENDNFDIDR